MKIPTSFQLVNTTWSVQELSKDVADAGNRYGDCCRSRTTIRIYSSDEHAVEDTYAHELAHALLAFTTKPELVKNEKFVQSLGEVICQYLNTAKGTFKVE